MSGENDEKTRQILPTHDAHVFAHPDTIEPTLDSPWSEAGSAGVPPRVVVACSVRACSLEGKRSVIWAGSGEESQATGEMANRIV